MAAIAKTVLVGNQAGKLTLTGAFLAQEFVELLRGKEVVVNPKAQRSLVAGAQKEATGDLIDNDRVLKMPRMGKFLKFVKRVMDNLERKDVADGFFGSVSLVIPERFAKARLEAVPALPGLEDQIGILRARSSMGESIFHIADGQGRIVGFHALERELHLNVMAAKEAVKRLERKGLPAKEEREQLAELEKQQKRVWDFLSETHLPFVCYARELVEGAIVGLDEIAEKRCYIEGNALNSQASKEDIIKYETFSPIIVDLQSFRDELDWMDPQFIEEDSKSISSSSPKLFTLSALAQTYSWSLVNDNKPVQNLDANLAQTVDARKEFCHAFWRRVTNVLQPVWLAEIDGEPGARAAYLKEARQFEKQIVFQAVFLQALGRLCFAMGSAAEWNPDSSLLKKLDQLSPEIIGYRAVEKYRFDQDDELVVLQWNEEWRNAMMKPSLDRQTGQVKGYSFNNASENISATLYLLAKKIGFAMKEAPTAPPEAAGPAAPASKAA